MQVKRVLPHQLLIPPGKHKTAATIFEPNLKQALLNTGIDTGQVHTCDSHRMLQIMSGAYRGKPHKATHFLPSSDWGQGYSLMYLLPTGDQAHPLQMGQPTLYTDVKMHGLLSYVSNSFSIPANCLSLGKWDLQAFFCFLDLLSTII